MRLLFLLLASCLSLVTGCGGKESREPTEEKKVVVAQNEVGRDDNKAGPVPPRQRKIKYSGVTKVVVEDFRKSMEELEGLVIKNKGYVAQSEITNSPGEARSGHWKLRIPAGLFQAVREVVAKLGEMKENSTDSKDVTEEYYDLLAHIKNMKEEEAGLRKLFQASTGKLDDILKVRAELTRVRTEIDQHEGRLSALKQLTDMTTLDVYLYDRHTYVPPDAATYGTTIERTFFGSIDMLVRLGKGAFLAIVAISPWLPIIAALAVPLWLIFRRARRLSNSIAPVIVQESLPPP